MSMNGYFCKASLSWFVIMGKVNLKSTYSLQNIFYHIETFLLKNEACVEAEIPSTLKASRASLGGLGHQDLLQACF